jgi:hypothetical protein
MHSCDLETWSLLGDLSQSKSRPHRPSTMTHPQTTLTYTLLITHKTHTHTHSYNKNTYLNRESRHRQRINESKEDKHNQRKMDRF